MSRWFVRFANAVSSATGSVWAFAVAFTASIAWAATGPVFHWSTGWNFAANSSTTVVTFLMVFIIQTTQNRDQLATQVKLDELIRVTEARNQLRDIEDADPERLKQADEARKGN